MILCKWDNYSSCQRSIKGK